MLRRSFLVALLGTTCLPFTALAANRKFVFKVKTKSGGIIGNVVIEAKDMFAAVAKLKKRYPDCEILEGREK